METLDRETLTGIVFQVIRSRIPDGSGDLTLYSPLGAAGLGIDSIDCLEIILELEELTGITLRDESLTGETLTTPGTLIDYLSAIQSS